MKPIPADHRTLTRGMTVAALIRELETFPDDAIVCFACDYGDYHHTEQCLPVETADEVQCDEALVESAYSRSGLAVEQIDYEDEDDAVTDQPGFNVVILRHGGR